MQPTTANALGAYERLIHQYLACFSGYLKMSLEELLTVLRDERHLLLGSLEQGTSRYPDGFSAGRLAAIVEGNELWSMLAPE
jgi:hypothetical protein